MAFQIRTTHHAAILTIPFLLEPAPQEQDEGGTGGSKGIVFVEQVCVTEPLAVALSRLGVTAEAVPWRD